MGLSKLSYKPTPRYGHVAVAVGHRQFTWGGVTIGDSKEDARSVEVFDLSSEQWEKRPTRGSPPPGYTWTAYTTIGTTLYSFGGYDGRSRYNNLHRLDLSSLEWEEVVPRNPPDAPQRKSHCQMVSFQDNKLVVFGGFTDHDQWTDELHVFNIQEGTWSSPPTTGDKPPPCNSFTLTKIDDRHAVMFGGDTGMGHYLNDVFLLELGKWHWTKLEVSGPKPPARSDHAACYLAGPLTGQEHPLLMVVGGLGEKMDTFNDGWILDVDQRRWTKLDFPGDMQCRHKHTATVFGSAPDFRLVVLHGGRMTATTLLNLELECGVWRVTGVILKDQLKKRPEEKLRERMEKLWPSPIQQTSSRTGTSPCVKPVVVGLMVVMVTLVCGLLYVYSSGYQSIGYKHFYDLGNVETSQANTVESDLDVVAKTPQPDIVREVPQPEVSAPRTTQTHTNPSPPLDTDLDVVAKTPQPDIVREVPQPEVSAPRTTQTYTNPSPPLDTDLDVVAKTPQPDIVREVPQPEVSAPRTTQTYTNPSPPLDKDLDVVAKTPQPDIVREVPQPEVSAPRTTQTHTNPSPPLDTATDCHPITDVLELTKALTKIGDWESLCYYLRVKDAIISTLRVSGELAVNKKRRCLSAYIDQGDACWEKVIKVVADYPFYKVALARDIAKKHGIDHARLLPMDEL